MCTRQDLDHLSLQELFDYWQQKRGNNGLPSRRDISPIDFPRHLPNLMLVDVERGADKPVPRFRYRLVGTTIVEASSEDRTGRYFDEVAFFSKNPEVIADYVGVVQAAAPSFVAEPFYNPLNGTTYTADRLILPLASNGKVVDMLMVYFRFADGPYAEP